ncbi:xanthine phosphoribosyltransferase [Levilactobacillus bambusae]|uniref:Xanthine phosphoribosyltransferase n=1 Tax=Levilactobacillus bambusae TaxID=2024736 RepID=A0A2V1MYV2_9LACO|nr:xanthine phosphoribosyltransferase [Levilactobacillus bambusae]PWF99942.1 xanthine phosphoribosyltransferase [Levilactobacillus bambusae]
MKLLEDRIRQDGLVLPGDVLKVDAFLNHQVDPELMQAMGEEFGRLFKDEHITKVLTVESSGIAPAIMTALALKVPMIFARKHKSLTLTDNLYTAQVYSYTKRVNNDISIDKRFVDDNDRVLIIDDFLANGQAVKGLMEICQAANVEIGGVGVVIEKSFQKGHQMVLDAGIHLEALASVASLADNQVTFVDEL